ncbi:nucleolin isoform X1 [Brachypodium distachyon]|uniref:RRM domain-containing protein n=1 Tax=Brachypodium distachyon TaxID=15368 RepID=A0A0Q3FAJ2_BRADI|nr:nucleolin isoform X1 [Brachypodium distachyon]KQJ96342.1 hypothetical protein BRADI_3g22570v3 [Brachypodium distachyon]|eukprot:XP_010234647.1 nucleolin isoform X1 [Brachypodium distachyon]
MPRARKRRAPAAAASECSPVQGVTPGKTAEAGVRVRDEGEAMEVEPEEANGLESDQEDPDEVEPEEQDPDVDDPEEAEEDPEEAAGSDEGDGNEEGADEDQGNGEEVVGLGDDSAGVESEKAGIKIGGDEEKGTPIVLKEGGDEDTCMEPAVVEKPEEAVKEDAMENDTANLSGDGATTDDMNEIPGEEHEESGDEGTKDKDGIAGQLSVNGDVRTVELDPSLPALGPVSVENAKDLELFVGGLPKDCAEEDITVVFSQFGEIESIKIIKHSARKKGNCIAFVRYMNTEAAKKAVAEFKEGVEVKGKTVTVSAAQGNNTLYLGNICKSWTKDKVLNTLKSIGVEELEMSLPDDPDTGGRNRGFAFLKFSALDKTEAAFQQLLKQRDAFIDIDRSANFSARTPTESSEELAMKIKTVYLEHVPLSWDKSKIEECCEAYGEIHEVRLVKKSRKKISFVEFSSRMSALACVEGINSAKIGGEGGEVKLAASLARPRRLKLDDSAKGGLKVNSGATSEDANSSIKKKDQKKEVVVKSSNKLLKRDVDKLVSQVDAEVAQTSSRYKGKKKSGKNESTSVNERPSKKARKNRDVPTRSSNRTRHGGSSRAAYGGKSAGNMKLSAGARYATSYQSYPAAGASSRSKPNSRDLEPHAGYIPPANRIPANHVQITYVYDQPRSAPSTFCHIDSVPHAREIGALQPTYSIYTSNPQYQGGYAYTYLPPPPSGSYRLGSGAYSPPRRYTDYR